MRGDMRDAVIFYLLVLQFEDGSSINVEGYGPACRLISTLAKHVLGCSNLAGRRVSYGDYSDLHIQKV